MIKQSEEFFVNLVFKNKVFVLFWILIFKSGVVSGCGSDRPRLESLSLPRAGITHVCSTPGWQTATETSFTSKSIVAGKACFL